jgi:hypothetical protein
VGDYDLVASLKAEFFAERLSPPNPLPAGAALVQIQPAAAVPST